MNFPVLILSMYWRRLTTRGAVVGGSAGLAVAVACMIFGPTMWVEILGFERAIFPYRYPALFSMVTAFVVIVVVSLTDRSPRARDEIRAFDGQYVRSLTGMGAAEATSH